MQKYGGWELFLFFSCRIKWCDKLKVCSLQPKKNRVKRKQIFLNIFFIHSQLKFPFVWSIIQVKYNKVYTQCYIKIWLNCRKKHSHLFHRFLRKKRYEKQNITKNYQIWVGKLFYNLWTHLRKSILFSPFQMKINFALYQLNVTNTICCAEPCGA